jgi:hypothetical protein
MNALMDRAALRGLLSLLPGNDSAAEREAASLSLVLHLRHVPAASALQTLRSLAALESYSQSLQRYPLVKQAFWEQLLASELMLNGLAVHRRQLQLRDERFPRLVLDLSRCKLSEELTQALKEFLRGFPRPPQSPQSPFTGVKAERGRRRAARVAPVALKLVRCRLTVADIEQLKALLLSEETGAGYCVTSLDLSENAMKSRELVALAALLEQCGRRRLPLQELVLENAVGRALTTDNWAAFRAFVGAALAVKTSGSASLKRLSLANNSLSSRHVGCICSALRCEGTALEELSLAHAFSLVDPADRKACWQWLALGLRPMLPHKGLRRLDLSGNPLFPMDSEAWLGSLRDPQAAVLQWGESAVDPAQPSRAAVRCLLSSNTELFLLPSEEAPRLRAVESEVKAAGLGAESQEWEVLASQAAWLCVVVPGFGVAWTQAKHAMSWEHTEAGETPGSAVLAELVMNDMAASLTTTEALESFVGGFGGRLEALELRRNALSAMDLDAVLAGCQQLHTLDVEGCRLLQLQLLVDALGGALGQHLRTLNLNANLVGADSVNVLAAALRDRVPVLEELRVAHNEIGASGVRHLHAALEANKRLLLLELDLPSESAEAPRRPDDDEYVQLYRTRCMRLDVAFQNELLGVTPLRADRKIAFLLALDARDVVLDRGICSGIFSFAADEKRRRILWNAAHP